MKYLDFKNKIRNFPVFSSSQLSGFDEKEAVLRNQLSYWKKKGLVLEVKKGLYVLNEHDRKITPSRYFLANHIYAPSYVSTEFALGHYGLIPERIFDVTSVTPRKTARFHNPFGLFIYQHIGISCFDGFRETKDENNLSFMIASPEKAVIDFIYLNLGLFTHKQPELFELSYRFQNIDLIDPEYLLSLAACFQCKKLIRVVDSFIEYFNMQRG